MTLAVLGVSALFVRLTDGPEAAGMVLVVYGLLPAVMGCALLVVGVVVGVRHLLLDPTARRRDRILWVVGQTVAVAVALVPVAGVVSGPSAPSIDPDDESAILEASLIALGEGRLDVHQVPTEPVFPSPPVILRTHRAWNVWSPSAPWADRMVSEGVLAGTCAERDLAGCAPSADASFVSFGHAPTPLTGYVSMQVDLARAGANGCASEADSVDVTTFRLGVVRRRVGWEVAWVVTVTGGRRACIG